jgi:hypothetical protein
MPDEEAERVVDMFNVFEDAGEKMLERLPTSAERSTMQRRSQALHGRLRPVSGTMTDKEAAVRALSSMFGGFPSLRNADTQGMIAAYMLDLQELPLFAIEAACVDVRKGRIVGLDKDWPPSAARVFEAAERHATKVYGEKLKFDRVLAITKVVPPPLSPEAAAEMAGKLKSVAGGIEARDLAEREAVEKVVTERTLRENQRQIVDAWRARGQPPIYAGPGVLVSPYLIDKLKGVPGPGA